MGVFSFLRRGERLEPTPRGYELVTDVAPLLGQVAKLTPAQLYRSQPHLRTVVSFVARNVAKIGLHLYERMPDGGRERVRTGEGVEIFRRSDNLRTDYGLMYSLAATLALYDVAYWWIVDTPAGRKIVEIQPTWVMRERGSVFERPDIEVVFPGKHESTRIKANELVRFAGWSPDSVRGVSSPVEALREVLAEQIEAVAYRQQVWARGGRVSSVIVRPPNMPWSNEARSRFQEDWRRNWTGAGAKAGGTPILEDGMELKQSGFSPRESEWVDVAKLSQATVAAVYHINPTMIGVLDNANYSNVREFRKSLYGDSLGPTLKQIQAFLNQNLLPMLGIDPEKFYYEFNVAEQLQATPEEQAATISSAVGAPWWTRNEARRLQNLPMIEGGDELITPLNVVEGGLASPRDTAPKQVGQVHVKSGGVRFKSASLLADDDTEAMTGVLVKHAGRVMRTVKARLGAKAASADWWDEDRWDAELAEDLAPVVLAAGTRVGREAMRRLTGDEADYDAGRTQNFFTKFAQVRAHAVNAGIFVLINEARNLAGESSLTEELNHALEVFTNARATSTGQAMATAVANFATTEAGKQTGGRVTKTWIVTSGNPRASHAAMDGESVPNSETFSNGMRWPGDYNADADETVNCHCQIELEMA